MKKIHYISKELIANRVSANFAVIGAGGTGSQVLHNLAKMNIALGLLGRRDIRVCVYDNDVVTKNNIGRQGFYDCDIGMSKAEVLVNRLNYTYGTGWTYKKMRWKDEKLNHNFIISCVDNANTRLSLDKHFKRLTKQKSRYNNPETTPLYWVDFGNTKHTGQMIVSTVFQHGQPKSDTFRTKRRFPSIIDMYPNLKEMEEHLDQGAGCSIIDPYGEQELFINSALATVGINMIYRFIKEYYTFYRGLYLNLATFKTSPIEL